MFESLRVPKFHVANSALLALYSNGKTTGLVFESGDGATCSVPFFDGFNFLRIF